ncbi:MAG: hypothetical protein IJN91_02760 [Alphaproteobacteria bacterium]|nr:hypothetical protein [Alphaproteobacteria bacterium]
MKKFFAGLCILSVIACAVKLSATINFSDLISETNKTIVADLRVAVPSCSEDDIQTIQMEFATRNIRANYNKCSTDDMWNSYANFSLPITIVKQSLNADSDIFLQFINNGLYVRTSDKLSVVTDTSNDIFVEKINITSIEFYLVNDTNDSVKIKTGLAFVDDEPVYNKIISVNPYDRILIKLPDVANKLLEKSNAEYLIFEVITE